MNGKIATVETIAVDVPATGGTSRTQAGGNAWDVAGAMVDGLRNAGATVEMRMGTGPLTGCVALEVTGDWRPARRPASERYAGIFQGATATGLAVAAVGTLAGAWTLAGCGATAAVAAYGAWCVVAAVEGWRETGGAGKEAQGDGG